MNSLQNFYFAPPKTRPVTLTWLDDPAGYSWKGSGTWRRYSSIDLSQVS